MSSRFPLLAPLLLLTLPVLASGAGALARPSVPEEEITLRTNHEWATEPLTTERARMLDTEALNPHRQRWLLSRQTQLRGLEARKLPASAGGGRSGQDVFGVRASLLESMTRSYVRPAGPWYRPLTEFPCLQEPQPWFANEAGTREAAEVAARHWEEVLAQEKPKLAWMLNHVTARTAPLALVKARDAFEIWLKNTESEWRYSGGVKARLAEWRSYLQSASIAGICKDSGRRPEVQPVPWSFMMEPPAADSVPKVLVRAPARRWNGLFSVRLNVLIGLKRLSGQFLVDSGAGKSILSPKWLESQGVLPALVQSPDTRVQRVNWSGGSGLATQAVVDGVDMSGFELSLREFMLFETDFFQPPESQAECCDGILGSDFLRKNIVEFLPGTPPALRIWTSEGFQQKDQAWVEVALTASGEAVSACRLEPQKPRGENPPVLSGVRWDTGSEVPLDIHIPWQSVARREGLHWKLSCGPRSETPQGARPVTVAERIPVTFPHLSPGASRADETLFSSRYPAMNAGIALLDRAPFVFDLPHGRLWFSKEAGAAPFYHDDSGLVLEYRMIKGERVLLVKAIKPGSPAQALMSAGLRAGQHLSELDSRAAEDMDFWEVEQRLSGAYGNTVQVKWKFRDGTKSAALKVR